MGRRHWRLGFFAPATVVLLAAASAPALAGTAQPASHATAHARSQSSATRPDWMNKFLTKSGHTALYCGGVASFNCSDLDGRYAATAGHAWWYVGHDEPSALFYSHKPGSGNSSVYLLQLPKDPVKRPKPSATGGTWNFQLHPAFWFGMVMCDGQSFPEATSNCTPDSDTNIRTSTNPASPSFIGNHPGAAYMEMQFYPPGWAPWPAGVSCDPHKWCAALTIDSYNASSAGVNNNSACLNTVGVEPVNFAFITKSGKPQAPPDPTQATAATFTPNPAKDLFMNPGDKVGVAMQDTPHGFQVRLVDFTSRQSGAMTAGAGNGFGQVQYQPASTTCNSTPFSFHPMYSTSSPSTRTPWAAHSYNVAFADEIGHFEYCNSIATTGDYAGYCSPGAGVDGKYPDPDPKGPNGSFNDDYSCFSAAQSLLVKIGGCIGGDGDFDGPEYANNWAGTGNPNTPQPIRFTSPWFISKNALNRYSQTAFEADLPRIEDPTFSETNNCNRSTGAGCSNPPIGPNGKPIPFYPIFTTSRVGLSGGGVSASCTWQLGGTKVPGTKLTFGGSSKKEYGPLLKLVYPTGPATTVARFNDYRQILRTDPC
jgi:hypothetical protein